MVRPAKIRLRSFIHRNRIGIVTFLDAIYKIIGRHYSTCKIRDCFVKNWIKNMSNIFSRIVFTGEHADIFIFFNYFVIVWRDRRYKRVAFSNRRDFRFFTGLILRWSFRPIRVSSFHDNISVICDIKNI